QAEDGIRDFHVTGVQTCALPIFSRAMNLPFGPKAALSPWTMAVKANEVRTKKPRDHPKWAGWIPMPKTTTKYSRFAWSRPIAAAGSHPPIATFHGAVPVARRSEEHTSELQSRE